MIRFAQGVPRLAAGASPGDGVGALDQGLFEKSPDATLVFDDEDFRRSRLICVLALMSNSTHPTTIQGSERPTCERGGIATCPLAPTLWRRGHPRLGKRTLAVGVGSPHRAVGRVHGNIFGGCGGSDLT